MLPLLLLAALGAPGAAPFVLQLASWCPLATNGSVVATNDSQVVLALSQLPLLCGDLQGEQLAPCPGAGGPLVALGATLAGAMRGDPRWARRLRQRRELCRGLPEGLRATRRAPPQLRIVPERSAPALTLVCHAWGFRPAALTLRWLRDGRIAEPSEAPRPLPAGDGTFRAQLGIRVSPGSRETLQCSALQPGLQEPVSVTWAPGPSPALSLLLSLALLALLPALLLLALGLRRYLAPAPGYSPLPGDTYAGSS